jgi:poly-beta-hydroxyalkanoate depolymerase
VKEKTVAWNEILELEYKSARYKITKVDNSNIILDLPTENYRQVQGIKEIIKSFATEKGIHIQ